MRQKTFESWIKGITRDFPVRKCIDTQRRKGVMVEDIMEYLTEQKDFDCVSNKMSPGGMLCGSHGSLHVADVCAIEYHWSRFGIPSLYLYCHTEKVYKEIRDALREKKLIR